MLDRAEAKAGRTSSPVKSLADVTSGTVFLDETARRAEPLAGALFALHGLGVKGRPEPLFGIGGAG